MERIAGRLRAAAADGIGAIGECTPIGTGRYVDVMVEASRRSGVAVVGATGFFHEGWTPVHPIARALDLDALTDLYTRELTEGMGSTTVRAGLIKCATGEGRIGGHRGQAAASHRPCSPGDQRADRRAHHRFIGGGAARPVRIGGRRPGPDLHQSCRRRRALAGPDAGRIAAGRERQRRHDQLRRS